MGCSCISIKITQRALKNTQIYYLYTQLIFIYTPSMDPLKQQTAETSDWQDNDVQKLFLCSSLLQSLVIPVFGQPRMSKAQCETDEIDH